MTPAHADLAMQVERDLLHRFPHATPGETWVIECTAQLAVSLAQLDVDVRADGANELRTRLHTSMARSLTRGMELLGTARTAGSAAEFVLSRALQTQDALLMLHPAAGNA
jgi:hypothetical protein